MLVFVEEWMVVTRKNAYESRAEEAARFAARISTITATGYRYTTRSTSTQFVQLLTADDLLQGGPALTVAGNVAGGVLLNSTSSTDTNGVVTTSAASITSFSGAPAVVNVPAVAGVMALVPPSVAALAREARSLARIASRCLLPSLL